MKTWNVYKEDGTPLGQVQESNEVFARCAALSKFSRGETDDLGNAQDIAADRFCNPGYTHTMYESGKFSRLLKALMEGFCNSFRDAWWLISHPNTQFALGLVLACWLVAAVLVGTK